MSQGPDDLRETVKMKHLRGIVECRLVPALPCPNADGLSIVVREPRHRFHPCLWYVSCVTDGTIEPALMDPACRRLSLPLF